MNTMDTTKITIQCYICYVFRDARSRWRLLWLLWKIKCVAGRFLEKQHFIRIEKQNWTKLFRNSKDLYLPTRDFCIQLNTKKNNWNSVSGRFMMFRYAQMKTKWSQARWGPCCFQESGMETLVQYGHQDLSVHKPADVDQVFPAATIQYVWGLWWQEDYRMNNI